MCKRSFLVFLSVLILGPVGSAMAASDPTLVGWWTFDEGSGTTAMDSSGSGPDISLVNTTWEGGYLGGAVHFHGEGYGADTAFTFSENAITLCTWVWHDAFAAGQVERYVTMGPEAAVIRRNSDGRLHFYATIGGSFSHIYVSDVLTEGQWHHVAGTWDGTTQILYLDGVEIARLTPTGVLTGGTMVRLSSPDGEPLNGMLDDVRIYNRALSQDEILSLMSTEPATSAYGPSPKDEAMVGQTRVQLTWRPGESAGSHKVYFGESFDDVSEGLVEPVITTDASLTVGTTPPYAMGLTPGQTYYWRVDEVNDLDPNSPWKGNVWSFWVQPLVAYNPSPADGVPFILLDPDLAWEGGMGVLFHTVFFGESYEEVDAMTVGWMTAAATIAPTSPQLYGPLQAETTYYWRVDEFAMTGVTTRGDIWSFTTAPEIAVSDPDLTGWWTLDEGVGANALDWSGNGHHGTFVGDPQWADGYHGGALQFGSGDYVETGADATDLGIEGNKPKTTMAWALTRRFTGGGLWDLGSNTDGRNWSVRTMTTTNVWRVQRYGYPTYDFDVTVPTLNEWAHFALVYDGAAGGNDSRLYVNGEVVGNQTVELDTNPTTRTFQIGLWSGTSFDGAIEDVRVYAKALTETEITEIMRGNPLLAGIPNPSPGATVEIRDATMLSWVAGDTAVSHDVYFGTDRAAVAAADNSAAEFRGNQPGTSASLAGLVELGGDYYWRIDEVEANGAVQTGYVWTFTIPDYLVVEDFESYTNEVGSRVFEKWIDGVGFTQPVNTPGNNTGALVGHDIWTVGTTFTTIVETGNVHGGGQAMPIYYDNTVAPFRSEADRTFTPGQDWTAEGVTTLVVHFRGEADNTGDLYVEINGVQVPYDGDPADIASRSWVAWEIELASIGASLTNITTMTIGIEGGQTGVLYVDDIILAKP
ncbi:MAG: LamG domain-containing protein [Sedimentisphaerales bacterium]|nr:LamG domain-containing protein [Sedimentisphaerales bacterium]